MTNEDATLSKYLKLKLMRCQMRENAPNSQNPLAEVRATPCPIFIFVHPATAHRRLASSRLSPSRGTRACFLLVYCNWLRFAQPGVVITAQAHLRADAP